MEWIKMPKKPAMSNFYLVYFHSQRGIPYIDVKWFSDDSDPVCDSYDRGELKNTFIDAEINPETGDIDVYEADNVEYWADLPISPNEEVINSRPWFMNNSNDRIVNVYVYPE